MSANLEKLENNMVKITVTVEPEEFEKGMDYSYKKNKSRINVQGFRKGKVPRKIVESQYGPEVLYDDAVNYILPDAYSNAVKELDLKVASKPNISVEEIKKGEGFTFTAEVAVMPDVTLGEYKGIQINKLSIDVTDEEIQKAIKEVQDKNARLITVNDRPSKLGDIVIIDFEGFIDDVPFENGKAQDYELELGSHSFIDTFEDQLVDKEIGDDVEVNVVFPENYSHSELSGKKAMFKVEIKDIKYKELPELDDEFAKDVSEFDTLDEYKASIKDKLLKQKEESAIEQKEDRVLEKIIENSKLEVPQIMIDENSEMLVNNYARGLNAQGLSLDMYLKYMNQTKEQFKAGFDKSSEFNVKAKLVLCKIAEAENFEATEEDIDRELEEMSKQYNVPAEKLKSVMTDEEKIPLEEQILTKKALDFVVENAVEV